MKKATKLIVANTALLLLLPLMLFSAVQMEVSEGDAFAGIPIVRIVVIHVAVSLIMVMCVLWHLYLHFGWKGWIKKFKNLKSRPTRIIAIIAGLVLITGLMALAHLYPSREHGAIGGIHGKIGFLFIAFAIGHIIKRWWWIRKNLYFESLHTNKH